MLSNEDVFGIMFGLSPDLDQSKAMANELMAARHVIEAIRHQKVVRPGILPAVLAALARYDQVVA